MIVSRIECIRSYLKKQIKLTVSLDGKTICSTNRLKGYESPLHIVSTQFCEMGITLVQKSVSDKNNEIPAVHELLKN